MENRPQLLVIAGPTAVGKTSYSLHLAQKLQCPVISADSRQVFQDIRIGTARITEQEMEGVPHHLLGHVSLESDYDVARFEKETLELLESLFEEYPNVILTGGTGLYIKAVTQGLDRFPEVPKRYREAREKQLLEEGLQALSRDLENIDPEYFRLVDKANPARLIRALSHFDATGIPFSRFLGKAEIERPFDIKEGWLNLPRELLRQRIEQRVHQMMQEGLLEEVRSVYNMRNRQALQTVGYQELFRHMAGDITLEEAVEEIIIHTRQYAKRQVTWFKKYIQGPELDARDWAAADSWYFSKD